MCFEEFNHLVRTKTIAMHLRPPHPSNLISFVQVIHLNLSFPLFPGLPSVSFLIILTEILFVFTIVISIRDNYPYNEL